MNSQTPTARLVKIIRRNETVRISNVIKHNGEFTKSPLETLNYLLDILSPGNQQTENRATRSDLDLKTIHSIPWTIHLWDLKTLKWLKTYVHLSVWKQLLTNFNHLKHQGQTGGLYPVLLQKGWNQLKEYYRVIFQACLRHSYVPLAWKEGTGIFLLKPGKERYFDAKSFRMITLTSFQLKWLERLILYHINEDSNVQAKLSASQYGFRAGVSTETALHEFVRRVEHCLVRKKPALGIFLDIVGAFDNVTFRQGVEPNLNPNRKPEWTVSFWWTRTEPEPAKFYFSEPEPNLNPQNCAQVNPSRTWTPNKSKNIFFHVRMSLALVHAQQEQWWSSTRSAISPFFFLDETSNDS